MQANVRRLPVIPELTAAAHPAFDFTLQRPCLPATTCGPRALSSCCMASHIASLGGTHTRSVCAVRYHSWKAPHEQNLSTKLAFTALLPSLLRCHSRLCPGLPATTAASFLTLTCCSLMRGSWAWRSGGCLWLPTALQCAHHSSTCLMISSQRQAYPSSTCVCGLLPALRSTAQLASSPSTTRTLPID